MRSSSRIATSGSAAWTSPIIEKISAVSDSMPIPLLWARPRMLPTGVSTVRQRVSATRPAMKAKVPLVTPNSAECEVPLASQTNSFNARRVREQVEHGAVDEANPDPPVGCGLNHVSLANRITSRDLNGNAARTPEGAAAFRRLNIANDLGKQARNGLTVVSRPDAERNEHWLRPRLLSNSGPAWCRSLLVWFCLRLEIHCIGADSHRLPRRKVLIKNDSVYLGTTRCILRRTRVQRLGIQSNRRRRGTCYQKYLNDELHAI